MSRLLIDLQSIFPEKISDIFIIPPECLTEKYRDKINFLIRLHGFSFLNFQTYSAATQKNLLDVWNENNKEPDKFWTVKTTKLLLVLAQLHAASDKIHIWIQGSGHICSIELFSKRKHITAKPRRLLRLSK